jgi:hypothetical protein
MRTASSTEFSHGPETVTVTVTMSVSEAVSVSAADAVSQVAPRTTPSWSSALQEAVPKINATGALRRTCHLHTFPTVSIRPLICCRKV